MFGMAGCTRHTVTLESLLREMTDIESVAEFPVPGYVCLQQSSHDRRSVAPDRPGWYANADGFGAIAIDTANGVIRRTLAGAAEQHDRKAGKEQRNRTASRSGTAREPADGQARRKQQARGRAAGRYNRKSNEPDGAAKQGSRTNGQVRTGPTRQAGQPILKAGRPARQGARQAGATGWPQTGKAPPQRSGSYP